MMSFATQIRRRADTEKLSLNKTIKNLLRQALCLGQPKPDHRADFQAFLGTWSPEESDSFHAATQELGRVDPADWT